MAEELDFSRNDGLNEEGGQLPIQEEQGYDNLESIEFGQSKQAIEQARNLPRNPTRKQPRKKLKLKPKKPILKSNIYETPDEVPELAGLLGTPTQELDIHGRVKQYKQLQLTEGLTEAQRREIGAGFAGKVNPKVQIQEAIGSADLALKGSLVSMSPTAREALASELSGLGDITKHREQFDDFGEVVPDDTSLRLDNGISQFDYQLHRVNSMSEVNKAWVRDLMDDPKLVTAQATSETVTPNTVIESLTFFDELIGKGRLKEFGRRINVQEDTMASTHKGDQTMMLSMLGNTSETKNILGAGSTLAYTKTTQEGSDKEEEERAFVNKFLDEMTLKNLNPKLSGDIKDKAVGEMNSWLVKTLTSETPRGALVRDPNTGLAKKKQMDLTLEQLQANWDAEAKRTGIPAKVATREDLVTDVYRSLSIPDPSESGVMGHIRVKGFATSTKDLNPQDKKDVYLIKNRGTGFSNTEYEAGLPAIEDLMDEEGKYKPEVWKKSTIGKFSPAVVAALQPDVMKNYVDYFDPAYDPTKGGDRELYTQEVNRIKSGFKRARKFLRAESISNYSEDMGDMGGSASKLGHDEYWAIKNDGANEGAIADLEWQGALGSNKPAGGNPLNNKGQVMKGSDQGGMHGYKELTETDVMMEAIHEGVGTELAIRVAKEEISLDEALKLEAASKIPNISGTQTDLQAYKEKVREGLELGEIHKQKSEGWHNQREGNITASAITKILGNSKEGGVEGVANKLANPKPFVPSADVKRGNDQEDKIKRMYTQATGLSVQEAYYEQSKESPRHGASPDGYAFDKHGKFQNLVEIKSHASPEAESRAVNDYKNQAQWQMYITGKDKVELVTMNEIDQELNRTMIHRDDEVIEQLRIKADEALELADKLIEDNMKIDKTKTYKPKYKKPKGQDPREDLDNGEDPIEAFEQEAEQLQEEVKSYNNKEQPKEQPNKVAQKATIVKDAQNKANKKSKKIKEESTHTSYNQNNAFVVDVVKMKTATERAKEKFEATKVDTQVDGGTNYTVQKTKIGTQYEPQPSLNSATIDTPITEEQRIASKKASDYSSMAEKNQKKLEAQQERDQRRKDYAEELKLRKEQQQKLHEIELRGKQGLLNDLKGQIQKSYGIKDTGSKWEVAKGGLQFGKNVLDSAVSGIMKGADKTLRMEMLGSSIGSSADKTQAMVESFMDSGMTEEQAVTAVKDQGNLDKMLAEPLDGVKTFTDMETKFQALTKGSSIGSYEAYSSMSMAQRSKHNLSILQNISDKETRAKASDLLSASGDGTLLNFASRSGGLEVDGLDTVTRQGLNVEEARRIRKASGEVKRNQAEFEGSLVQDDIYKTVKASESLNNLIDTGAEGLAGKGVVGVSKAVHFVSETFSGPKKKIRSRKTRMIQDKVDSVSVSNPTIDKNSKVVEKIKGKAEVQSRPEASTAQEVQNQMSFEPKEAIELTPIDNPVLLPPPMLPVAVPKAPPKETEEKDNNIEINVTVNKEETEVETNVFGTASQDTIPDTDLF